MDREKRDFSFQNYLGNALVFNSILFAFILLPLFIFATLQIISLPTALYYLVPMFLLSQSLSGYKQKLWIIQEKPIHNTLLEAGKPILNVILSILFVFFIFQDWRGRIIGLFLVEIIILFISLSYLFKEEKPVFKLNINYLKDLFFFGFPLIFHGVGLTLIGVSDKFLINSLIGLKEVGIYGVALSLSNILIVFIMPIDKVLMPYIFKYLDNYTIINKKKLYSLFILNLIYLILIGFLITIGLNSFATYIIGVNFSDSISLIPTLILAKIFYGLYRFSVRPLFYKKQTYLVSISTLISGAVGIIIQYYLIKNYNLIGAAWGYSFSNLLSFILVFIFSFRLLTNIEKEKHEIGHIS